MKQRILNLLICLDQLAFCLLTFGASDPDETMSAAAWRLENAGKLQGKIFRPVIDLLFTLVEREHCKKSFEDEYNRAQMPKEYH